MKHIKDGKGSSRKSENIAYMENDNEIRKRWRRGRT